MTKLRKISSLKPFPKKITFVILVFAIGFFNSCNQQQELLPENQAVYAPIEERSHTDLEDAAQKVREIFSCGGGVISDGTLTFFEETFGVRNDVKIIYYSNEGTRTFAFPLLKNDEIANLLLVSEDDNFYILEKTDRLAYGDVADTNISPYTARVFDAGSYLSTDIDLSNVRSNLGTHYEVDREADVLILKEKTANSGRLSAATTGKLAPLCSESVLSSMASEYLELFGLRGSYQNLVYDAIVDSQPVGACWCPNPTLVLEHLIPNVLDDVVKQQLIDLYFVSSIVVSTPPATTWLNPQTMTDCFEDCNAYPSTQSITIYADQPNPNSTATFTYQESPGLAGSSGGKSNIDVGHTFISLEQNVNGITHVLVVGFYPALGRVSPVLANDAGKFVDDSGHDYNVSVTYEVSCSDFQTVIAYLTGNYPVPGYNLNSFNCTDFGIEALNSISLNIPDNTGYWPLGGGSNPGNLGQDLRGLTLTSSMSIDDMGGSAPTQNCN